MFGVPPTIACRARRGHRPHHSPAAAQVLDDDGLSQRPAQTVGDGARDQVDASAGLHRGDDLDRLVRVTALRECARDKRCRDASSQRAKEFALPRPRARIPVRHIVVVRRAIEFHGIHPPPL
jgi:hypothetical protein